MLIYEYVSINPVQVSQEALIDAKSTLNQKILKLEK
jgi:hypothetical protein